MLAKEIKKNILIYSLLCLLLLGALAIRVYRTDQILGFYFDQGRDGLVIRDFINNHKLFLIGPTTGIAGIFRGPWYYWLIAPAYFLGKGNPVWPDIFLAITTVFSITVLYYLAFRVQDKVTGMIAVVLSAFSYELMVSSRWLSNPTPMLLLSMLLLLGMFKIDDGKKWGWVLVSFASGLSLFNFGSAAEVFYFPAIFIFALWQIKKWGVRKVIPPGKVIFASIILFVSTFLPLVLFDFKHGGILSGNIKGFLFTGNSFKLPSWRFVFDKFEFYYNVFSYKIFNGVYEKESFILATIAFLFTFFLSKLFKNDKIKIVLLMFVSPLGGLIFFQGNFGNIYDYYLTGYYLIFILLVSIVLGNAWKYKVGKLFVIYFLYLFLSSNIPAIKFYLSNDGRGAETITFATQKRAIDWIYENAKDTDFNVDVYVPPVIPYAYNYLFSWYGGDIKGRPPKESTVSSLYTLYEVDPPHPERLNAWLKRQEGIGRVLKEEKFGGITVQKRVRIKSL
ncbi:glycosyltransferase family 39 protein [Candidatus Woesebacteria bacterium]|nr:glycosyltransferase family 39 protein [Candidatus Woesebacteria bacterium]